MKATLSASTRFVYAKMSEEQAAEFVSQRRETNRRRVVFVDEYSVFVELFIIHRPPRAPD
jgi:hypothetical protein